MAGKSNKSTIEKSFAENESALKRFLERFFYNTQDAEDILQEAFLQMWRIEKKQEIQSPKSYLFKVARNLALKELRKKSNEIITYIGEINPDELLCNEAVTDNEAEINEKLDLFGKAISALPPQCRKAFVMRKVYGFSQKEIARRLEISESTVEKHLAAGLQRCNIYMHERGIDDLFAPSRHHQSESRIKKAR